MSHLSEYTYARTYRGKIKAAVLDWSGTLADAYVIAPAVVFVEGFSSRRASRFRWKRRVARWGCARICTSRS